jgi:hypothetical protein
MANPMIVSTALRDGHNVVKCLVSHLWSMGLLHTIVFFMPYRRYHIVNKVPDR